MISYHSNTPPPRRGLLTTWTTATTTPETLRREMRPTWVIWFGFRPRAALVEAAQRDPDPAPGRKRGGDGLAVHADQRGSAMRFLRRGPLESNGVFVRIRPGGARGRSRGRSVTGPSRLYGLPSPRTCSWRHEATSTSERGAGGMSAGRGDPLRPLPKEALRTHAR